MKRVILFAVLVLCILATSCNVQTPGDGQRLSGAQSSSDAQRLVGTWEVEKGTSDVGATYVFNADGTYTWTSSTSSEPQTGYWGLGPFENLGGNMYFMTERTINNGDIPTLWFFALSPDGKYFHLVRETRNGVAIRVIGKR